MKRFARVKGRRIEIAEGFQIVRMHAFSPTVSYFLRTASMCDTLLQMARWYGFRPGYEDLIRRGTIWVLARQKLVMTDWPVCQPL